MKHKYFFSYWKFLYVSSFLFLLLLVVITMKMTLPSTPERNIRYLPLGDSYTIGQGLPIEENFPHQLATDFETRGVSMKIVEEPARTGFTTEDLLLHEMYLVKKTKPDFITLLIGVNDWVRGVSEEKYQENIHQILDEILQELPAEKILIIAIPDFSLTPGGKVYAEGRNASEGIQQFNNLMAKEAQARNISFVDIFPLSQEQATKRPLEALAPDGLHYSEEGYKEWVKQILPFVDKLTLF